MELLITLLIVVIIIGALLGGKSFGGTVKKGCGCFIFIIILAVGVAAIVVFWSDLEKISESIGIHSIDESSVHFVVKENCPAYTQPNIESKVIRRLEIGEVFLVENINKFNYFYEITDENGKKIFIRKKYLSQLPDNALKNQ